MDIIVLTIHILEKQKSVKKKKKTTPKSWNQMSTDVYDISALTILTPAVWDFR